jgi:protein SCO1
MRRWRDSMITTKLLFTLSVSALWLCGGASSATDTNAGKSGMYPPPIEQISGDSLYQLPVQLTAADGASVRLSSLRGKPLVVTMFYSRCTSVCPMLTHELQRFMSHLSARERAQVQILMVSFDSAGDSPATLTAFKSEHQITEDNWLIAKASARDVRSLAAALGIQYRELPDHSFNHSAVISVADRGGTVRARTSDLSDADGTFIAAVRLQARAASSP